MRENPTVLVLVNDAGERKAVRRRLMDMEVVPIVVRADRATAAIEQYHPVAAVMDDAHAAAASEEFLEATCAYRVRLLTLPDPRFAGAIGDSALRDAVIAP